ncbi:AzlC family ABC transporter permease [Pseudobutyrivibrio xylanivorans]|uniref:Predicted branched-chain amino acid permease (Azaleucine resistance) n=1 Tax=Pseudobutyrivibrio xylanivorans TaxID=185007 RepID=A0A1G5RTW6_PSEXY|nr:AzlC family ABC transporter permease [Pseudobutyrivibrio xylanivorans]SCZ77447.1 Predicted branched-chain amino acid permease (azaleucine resistance) [Pseudobutyrivibrio xylanivorans]
MNNSMISTKTLAYREGTKDGVPIALGYFAVAFSLGILARNANFTPLQGFINSFLNHASAGEYAVYTVVAAGASYVEMAIMTLVVNARYLLMSTALSQKFDSTTSMLHRMCVGFTVTDELFAITIKRPGHIEPFYNYGAFIIAVLGWCFGTSCGIIAGELMPLRLVSAFSVALYGMFLACIMPEARKHRIVAVLIIISFVLSYIASRVSLFAGISSGTKTIILTVVIASIAAIAFPHPEEEDDD